MPQPNEQYSSVRYKQKSLKSALMNIVYLAAAHKKFEKRYAVLLAELGRCHQWSLK